MPQQQLNISNPFSTGGGGVSFERSVAAYYMVQMLCQEVPRGMPSGIAVSLRFQARQQGTPLDDLLIVAQDASFTRRLQIQSKHAVTFTANNSTFKEVIADAWAAFHSKYGFPFEPKTDLLGIAVAGLPEYVRNDLLPLLEWARTSASSFDFWQKANSVAAKRTFAVLLRDLLSEAHNVIVSEDDAWAFMKCLVVLEFDLEHAGSEHLNGAWNKLLTLTPDHSPALARRIFDTLLAEADRLAPLSGTIDRDSLRLAIRLRNPEFWPEFSPDEALSEDLQQIGYVYVPPTEYQRAKEILLRHKLVVLAGPPHSGKTATALHLALALAQKIEDKSCRIERVSYGDDVDTRHLQPNTILILDDWYGDIELENRTRAGRFRELERLTQQNFVIVTTRTSVLNEAQEITRLSEAVTFDRHVVRLSQEGSYDDPALTAILQRHLDYMQSEMALPAKRLTVDRAKLAWDERYSIVRELRFPHNIERLCAEHLQEVANDGQVNDAIQKAKYIEEATKSWADALEDNAKWFVFLVALFPAVNLNVLDAIYRKVAQSFGFAADDVSHLMAKTSSYISNSARPALSHPSYRQAVIALLREHYEHRVAEVADLGLAEVAQADTFALSRCAAADYGWLRCAPGGQFDIRKYLEQLVAAYNALRNRVFATLKPRLAPYTPTEASCLFLIYPHHSGGSLLIVASPDGVERIYVEQPVDFDARQDEISMQAWQAQRHQIIHTVTIDDLVRRSPQMHALAIVRFELEQIFQKQRLKEPWPLAYARVEKILENSHWRTMGLQINPDAPFGSAELVDLVNRLKQAEGQPPPQGYSPEIWAYNQRSFAPYPLALLLCLQTLEAQDKQYTGRLLPQYDLPFTAGTHTLTSLYSAAQMKSLIRRTLELQFEAYRQIIDANFASIKHLIVRQSKHPMRVVGAVTYNQELFGSRSTFIYLPPSFQTLTGNDFELYVFSDQENNDDEAPPFPPEVKRRLKEVEQSREWYTMTEGGLDDFGDLKTFIKTVYKWIKEDIDRALEWDEVGKERSRYFADISAQFAAANPGVSMAMDLTFNNDAFDWPSL